MFCSMARLDNKRTYNEGGEEKCCGKLLFSGAEEVGLAPRAVPCSPDQALEDFFVDQRFAKNS